MSFEVFEIPYGSGTIGFRLERRARKTLSISVNPDQGIDVVAPLDAPIEKVFEKVRKRAPWITRQVQYFDQFQPRTPERQYVAGETHMYLGRQYKLKVAHSIQERVKLYRGRLVVETLRPRQTALTKLLVENWYRDRAHIKFPERLILCRERFPNAEEFSPSALMVRQLKQRWGSMTPTGKLILNPALLRASVDTIDYVITHEVCHIKYPHHGPAFVELLTRVMPDWESRKSKLERLLA